DSNGAAGPQGTQTVTVTVSAAAPVVTILSPSPYTTYVANSTNTSLTARFTDVASSGPWTCAITWGDGTSSTGLITGSASPYTCTSTHMYKASGSPTITVTVTNKFTRAGSASVPVRVQ